MELINKNRIVIAIVMIVTTIVIIKAFFPGKFRYDADRWAEPSYNNKNLLTVKDIDSISGNKLIINLDSNDLNSEVISARIVNIAPDSILHRKYYSMLRDHDAGPVILMSEEPGLSARIWMLISQTGIKELYILLPDGTTETFRYNFRPLTDAAQ